MLHYQTVPKHTLESLKRASPRLSELGFHLAGGTALALRLGHRISVDLDFFKRGEFSPVNVVSELDIITQSQSQIIQQSKGSIALVNQETKFEFLRYDYPLLDAIDQVDGISLVSLSDNVAMKLSALVGRGSKKDFADLAALLETVDLPTMLDWYRRKFPNSDPFMVMKSLTWFEDAEDEPDPIYLKAQSWDRIKEVILRAVY